MGTDADHYRFVVFTQPHHGQEDAYNAWYEDRHLPDVLAIDGIVAAQRYRLAAEDSGAQGLPGYLTVYEVRGVAPDTVRAAIGEAVRSGAMPISAALDAGATLTAFYERL
jgi:hypothetical protein